MKRTEIAFTSIDPGYELVQRAMYGVANSIAACERSTNKKMVIELTATEPDTTRIETIIRISIILKNKKTLINVSVVDGYGKKLKREKNISVDMLQNTLAKYLKERSVKDVLMSAYTVNTQNYTMYKYTKRGLPNIYIDYVTTNTIEADDINRFKLLNKLNRDENVEAYPAIISLIELLENFKYRNVIMVGTEPIIFVGTKFSGHSRLDIADKIVTPEITEHFESLGYPLKSDVNLHRVHNTYNEYDSTKRLSTEIGYRIGSREDIISCGTCVKPLSWELLRKDHEYTVLDLNGHRYEETPYGDQLEIGHRTTPFIPPESVSEECKRVAGYVDTDSVESDRVDEGNLIKDWVNATYGVNHLESDNKESETPEPKEDIPSDSDDETVSTISREDDMLAKLKSAMDEYKIRMQIFKSRLSDLGYPYLMDRYAKAFWLSQSGHEWNHNELISLKEKYDNLTTFYNVDDITLITKINQFMDSLSEYESKYLITDETADDIPDTNTEPEKTDLEARIAKTPHSDSLERFRKLNNRHYCPYSVYKVAVSAYRILITNKEAPDRLFIVLVSNFAKVLDVAESMSNTDMESKA